MIPGVVAPILAARLLRGVPPVCALLLAIGPLAGVAPAQDRLVRRFAEEHGLAVPPVWALAQDTAGFLWIGAQGGLYRYDGIEFRRWAADRIVGSVFQVAAAADGRLAAQLDDGTIFELAADAVVRLPAPPGGYPDMPPTLAFDGRGRLWTVRADGAPVHRERGDWSAIPRDRLDGERARVIRPTRGGGVLVLTDAGLWHVGDPSAKPVRRFRSPLIDALSLADGRLILLTGDSRVLELIGANVRELASRAAGHVPFARPIALAERSGTIWASFDRYLLSLRPGWPPELIGPGDGIESGGPLLVDHEGSLWLGSFTALFQYPEPETTIRNDLHGLPSHHTRYLARVGDILWVTTWQGTGRVRRVGRGLATESVKGLTSRSLPCVDSLGVVWLATDREILRLRGDSVIGRYPVPGGINGCAAAPGPATWIGSDAGLFHADAGRGTLRRIDHLPFGAPDAPVHAVVQDRDGRLWVSSYERICHAPAAAVLDRTARWSCVPSPGSAT